MIDKSNKPQTLITPNNNTKEIKQFSIKDLPKTTLFDKCDKNILLFAYCRTKDQNPPDQIMIQQPKTLKKLKPDEEQKELIKLFEKVDLQNQTTDQLFLTKINRQDRKQIDQSIKFMLSLANQFSRNQRNQQRQRIFQASKVRFRVDEASKEVIANRRIKLVKMDSLVNGGSIKSVVQLGGSLVQYEDLGIMDEEKDYYTLIRKNIKIDQNYPNYPQMAFQENFLGKIEFQPQVMKQQEQNDQDFDSNDSDNPDYDYPQEQSSRSSQDIIRNNSDYDCEEDRNSDKDEDQEELYRKYLRRLKKSQAVMDVEEIYEQYD